MELTLVYDGGCIFCSHFALRSELTGGIEELRIVDGRKDNKLRMKLKSHGLNLSEGAVLMEGCRAWHGSEAITELSRRMSPSDPLLILLRNIFMNKRNAIKIYPTLLFARRLALGVRGLPIDPDN